jgi:hypothetical protein
MHAKASGSTFREEANVRKLGFTDEQILGVVNRTEGGTSVKALCRKHGFGGATLYKEYKRRG